MVVTLLMKIMGGVRYAAKVLPVTHSHIDNVMLKV